MAAEWQLVDRRRCAAVSEEDTGRTMERRHGKGRGRTEDVKTERERGGDLYIATNLTAHIHTSRQRGAY